MANTCPGAKPGGDITSQQGKLCYAVRLGLEELLRKRNGVAIFATFTFRENIEDKGEAQKRWRRLKERLRRWEGPEQFKVGNAYYNTCGKPDPLKGIGVWQRQKRGAWHLHMVFNQFIPIDELRADAVACGFGPMLNLRYVETKNQKGFMWNPRKVLSYMLRYVTRDIASDERDKGVRVVEYFGQGVRVATTSFGWARGFAELYRAGRGAWSDIFADVGQPTLDDYWFIIRLGWEVIDSGRRAKLIELSDAVARWWDPERFAPF